MEAMSKIEIFDKIREIETNPDYYFDFAKFYLSLTTNEDSLETIQELITYLWTVESDHVCPIIYQLINSCGSMSAVACHTVMAQVRQLLATDKLRQPKLIKIICILVATIRRTDNSYMGFFDLSTTECMLVNEACLAEAMCNIKQLTGLEMPTFIKQLVKELIIANYDQCLDLVREIFILCGKHGFQYCIGAVVNFFNAKSISSQLSQTSMTEDNRQLMSIQIAVLDYCLKIGKVDPDFVYETIKLCQARNSVYCISGFMCVLLLKLASLSYIKLKILDLLKNSIISCLNDTTLFVESAFARESNCIRYDLNTLLMNAVKFCIASSNQQITESLIELSFTLIEAGLPRDKVIGLFSRKELTPLIAVGVASNDFSMSIQQTIGQAGIQMVLHLFGKLSSFRKKIINDTIAFIVKQSYNSAVFVYIELLADLIAVYPRELEADLDVSSLELVLDLLYQVKPSVSVALIHALLPLVSLYQKIRSGLINILIAGVPDRLKDKRLICIQGILVVLKYFRIDPELGENSTNATLKLLSHSCEKFPCAEMTPLIYEGLVSAAVHNHQFASYVLVFLTKRLVNVFPAVNDDSSSSNCLNVDLMYNSMPVLVDCLSEMIHHSRSDPDLANAVATADTALSRLVLLLVNNDISQLLSKLEDFVMPKGIEWLLAVYDVLLAYLLSQEKSHELAQLWERREAAHKTHKRSHTTGVAVGLSLSSLAPCVVRLCGWLCDEMAVVADELYVQEKVGDLALARAFDLVRELGSSSLRVTRRNRDDFGQQIGSMIGACMCCYSAGIISRGMNPPPLSHACLLLYCHGLNKAMQHLSKALPTMLTAALPGAETAHQLLQGNLPPPNQPPPNQPMTIFIEVNRLLLKRILLLPRKTYPDFEPLLSLTLNLCIFCGLEKARSLICAPINTGRINTDLLNNLHGWLQEILCQSNEQVGINDAAVCRVFVSVFLNCNRFVMPDSFSFLDCMVGDVCAKIGYYDNEQETVDKTIYKFIIHAPEVLPVLITSITMAMDEMTWILDKWRFGWTELCQCKAIGSSQLSALSSTPGEQMEISVGLLTEHDRSINTQMLLLVTLFTRLTRANITNVTQLQTIMGLTKQVFLQLSSLTRQYIFLTRNKYGTFGSPFEKVLRASGLLSVQVCAFIVKVQIGRAAKEIMSKFTVIFAIKKYQMNLLELKNRSKDRTRAEIEKKKE